MNALGRLIAHENSASDLLAFLIELDPQPLQEILERGGGPHVAQREVQSTGRRLDLVVHTAAGSRPVAVLEFKGASDVYGDQLERYERWASQFDPAPSLFYCTLDGYYSNPPERWQTLDVATLFRAWCGSTHPHAAWLAGKIAELLSSWDTEANGAIGGHPRKSAGMPDQGAMKGQDHSFPIGPPFTCSLAQP